MSRTVKTAAAKVARVPPVEISSTPKPHNAFANSTSPVLSLTLSKARPILRRLMCLPLYVDILVRSRFYPRAGHLL